MRKLRALIIRLAGLFQRRTDHEMDEEFRAHLEMQIEDNLRAGMPPEEARRAALVKSGGIQAARENYREQRGLPFLETLMQDVRYGVRMLRKSPGFTFVAVLTLALGIGANTAIFSVVNAVLFERLPATDPDRLVQLWETEVSPGNFPFAGPDYLDWQAQNHTLEASTLYFGPRPTNGSHNGESQPLMVMDTQANYFSVLGVKAQIGRVFAPGEDQAATRHVAVLSYGYWQESFGGSEDIINKTVELNDEKYTIIGVMPAWCRFPLQADIFVPLDMSEKALGQRGNHSYRAIARLRKGVTPAQAQADLATIAARLEKQFPGSNNKVSAVVVPLAEQIQGNTRQGLLLLLAAVAAVLLLACANVANLLLARATGRQKEMSLRAVLGASRSRVVRQLLTESLLLSLGGGMIGLFGGFWLVRLIESSKQLPIPRNNPVQVNTPVLLFTFGLSVLVGIVFGLAPVFQAAKLDLGDELKSTAQSVANASRLTRGLRDGLVVLELGVSLALLIVAGLLLRSFVRLSHSAIGIDASNVATGRVMLPNSRYHTLEARREFCDRLLRDVQAVPGVQAAALSTEIPLEGVTNGTIQVPGDTNPAHNSQLVEYNYISPGYFQAMGIPLRQGTEFTEQDMDQTTQTVLKFDELAQKHPEIHSVPPGMSLVSVISSATAHMFWPGQDPVGKIFQYGGVNVRVLGVVGDVKQWGIRTRPIPQAYFPLPLSEDAGRFGAVLSIKSDSPPEEITAAIRGRLHGIDSSLALFQPRSMKTVIAENIHDATLETWLFGSMAVLALILAAIGLYSVLAYLVSQRTREIGIRMALGAQRADVLHLVMRHAALLTAVGLGVGLLLALAAGRLMKTLLFGVTAHDPVTFMAVVLVLGAIALLASLVPVRRAMRVDPMVALRYE